MSSSANVIYIAGTQWGDEGKGKLTDIISKDVDIVARCQGGNNAGHTIVVEDPATKEQKKFFFHLLPSGLLHPHVMCVIGNGVVMHLPSFFDEIKALEAGGISVEGRIKVSDRAHFVFDYHQIVDGLREVERAGDGKAIGTTKRGIGPCYSSKANRTGLRVCDLFHFDTFAANFRRSVESKWKRFGHFDYDVDKELERYKELGERLKPFVVDSVVFLNKALKENKRIMVEGANACLLDIDFGTYPYVTSSNCSVGGACTGLGIPATAIKQVIGVVKAYTTRVGGGPFPTEDEGPNGQHLQTVGFERGTTTGRTRRCGWLDVVVLRYSHMINGYTAVNLTKLDVLTGLSEIKVAVQYKKGGELIEGFPASLIDLGECEVVYETLPGWSEDISKVRSFDALPENCRRYVLRVEELMGVPIKYIGVGADRDATIYR